MVVHREEKIPLAGKKSSILLLPFYFPPLPTGCAPHKVSCKVDHGFCFFFSLTTRFSFFSPPHWATLIEDECSYPMQSTLRTLLQVIPNCNTRLGMEVILCMCFLTCKDILLLGSVFWAFIRLFFCICKIWDWSRSKMDLFSILSDAFCNIKLLMFPGKILSNPV